MWDLVGEEVTQNNVVENLVKLKNAANEAGIPVFYSPHYYTEYEYKNWKHLNHIDKVMFDRKMFLKGTWGAEFHPDLQPDENTFVLSSLNLYTTFLTLSLISLDHQLLQQFCSYIKRYEFTNILFS